MCTCLHVFNIGDFYVFSDDEVMSGDLNLSTNNHSVFPMHINLLYRSHYLTKLITKSVIFLVKSKYFLRSTIPT